MDRTRQKVWLAVCAGALLLVVAVLYFALPAHSLPALMPGHVSASDSEAGHHHIKHGIAALGVGLALIAYAWMNSGPAARSEQDKASVA